MDFDLLAEAAQLGTQHETVPYQIGQWPACAIFTFDGDSKLAGERVYFDGASLLKQLGVLA